MEPANLDEAPVSEAGLAPGDVVEDQIHLLEASPSIPDTPLQPLEVKKRRGLLQIHPLFHSWVSGDADAH